MAAVKLDQPSRRNSASNETGPLASDTLLKDARTELAALPAEGGMSADIRQTRSTLINSAFPAGALALAAYPDQDVHLAAELGYHPCLKPLFVEYRFCAVTPAPTGAFSGLVALVRGFFVEVNKEKRYAFTASVTGAEQVQRKSELILSSESSPQKRDTVLAEFFSGIIQSTKSASLQAVQTTNKGQIYGEATGAEEDFLRDIAQHFGYTVFQECQRRLTDAKLQSLEEKFSAELNTGISARTAALNAKLTSVENALNLAGDAAAIDQALANRRTEKFAQLDAEIAQKRKEALDGLTLEKRKLEKEVAAMRAQFAPAKLVDKDRIWLHDQLEELFPDRQTRPPVNDEFRARLLTRIADALEVPDRHGIRNVRDFIEIVQTIQNNSSDLCDNTSAKEADALVNNALELTAQLDPGARDELVNFINDLEEAVVETVMKKIRVVLVTGEKNP